MTDTTNNKRQELTEVLRNNLCEITFTKIDGSIRIMPCTLKEGVVPVYQAKEGAVIKKTNDENLSVWCTDKSQWRSFKVANVTNIRVL